MLKLLIILIMFFTVHISAELNVLLTVKEGSKNADAVNYPVKVGVPLPKGEYLDINSFRVTNSSGATIDAQFDILGRWIPSSNSIRVVLVQFLADVSSSSSTEYFLKDDGSGNASSGIEITEDSDIITINNGVLDLSINKNNFNIIDKLSYDVNNNGNFDSNELMINSDSTNGASLTDTNGMVLFGSEKSNLVFTWEEKGPIRTVLKVESPTGGDDENGWGFIVRLMAYKDQPFLAMDYYLKNSEYADTGHHLFFDKFSLISKLQNMGVSTVRFGGDRDNNSGAYESSLTSDVTTEAKSWKAYSVAGTSKSGLCIGYADISDSEKGVMATVRKFSKLHPTQLEVTSNKELKVNLWGPSDLRDHHMLVDQTRRAHQVMYYFHNGSTTQEELFKQASLFEKYPVPILMPYWYSYTRAIGDFGGIVPNDSAWNNFYVEKDFDSLDAQMSTGWKNWGGNIWRRHSAGTGGMPGYASGYIVDGTPEHFYGLDDVARHKSNLRPMWMDNYTYPRDQGMLRIAYPPPNGSRYPREEKVGDYWSSWDHAHPWVHEIVDYYMFSGERFAIDYLKIHADFYLCEKFYASNGDGNQQLSYDRGTGLPMAVVVDAYLASGEKRFWDYINGFAKNCVEQYNSKYGVFTGNAFQHGLFSQGAAGIYFLLPENTAKERELKEEYLLFMEGANNGQLYWGGNEKAEGENSWGMAYYWPWEDDTLYTRPPEGGFYKQASNFQGQMYFLMGDSAYKKSIGLVEGEYSGTGTVSNFSIDGDGYFKVSSAAWYHPEMKKSVIPKQINDITATVSYDNKVVLNWTSVGGDVYKVHWATKPIVEPTFTVAGFEYPYPDTNTNVTKLYMTKAIDVTVIPKEIGKTEKITLGPFDENLVGTTLYFDVQAVNIETETDMARSPMSNITSIVLDSAPAIAGPDFTIAANITSGKTPVEVEYTCTVNSGTATSYLWVFGDGTTSTEQNPNHTYINDGNFDVSCMVKDASENVTVKYINVLAAPEILIKEIHSMSATEIFVLMNTKVDTSAKISVEVIDIETEAKIIVTSVELDLLSTKLYKINVNTLEEGKSYLIKMGYVKSLLDVEPLAVPVTSIFVANFIPNKFSVRKLNIAPVGYEVDGWERAHFFDGSAGYNYPRWSCYKIGASGAEGDSVEESHMGLQPIGYAGATEFGEAWFKVVLSEDIQNYHVSLCAGASIWQPQYVSIIVEDSMVWDSLPLKADGVNFAYIDSVPMIIKDGSLDIVFQYISYVCVYPDYNFTSISYSLAVKESEQNNGSSLVCYPNPFNPSTVISLNLGTNINGINSLKIYNVAGKMVANLSEALIGKYGIQKINWNASSMATGFYFVRLKASNSNNIITKKVLLLK